MELGEAAVWDKPEYAQALGKERSALEAVVKTIDGLEGSLGDIADLLALASEENDTELFEEAKSDLAIRTASLEALEFRRMFSGAMDPNNAFLEIQAGSGGTEAQIGRASCRERV